MVELLAPAGDKYAFYSAINNGANAIYLGGKVYGARSNAVNFNDDEIVEMIKYAHLRNVKVYVTVNTLIKSTEIEDAIDFIEFLYINNVDAVIVQDIGLMATIIKKYPQLRVHASTQMNIHSVSQAKFLKDLGVKRIVLARELSIEEIKEIKKNVDIELEVFVHGALCMCYSGNCLMSSSIGGRSGNRGKCAQPCRMLYKLNDGEAKYYLSPKDLITIKNIHELIEAGIDSFKIEGRMKRSEYVAIVTQTYRKALDHEVISDDQIKKMKLVFNRKFTKGYIFNENNTDFTNVSSCNHLGVEIGRVVDSEEKWVTILLSDDLNINDGIRIVSSQEDGIVVNEIFVNNKLVKSAHKNDVIKIKSHHLVDKNSSVLKTTDAELINELNSIEDKQIDINAKIYSENNHLVLELSDGKTIIKEISDGEIERANNDLSERIISQIKKTANTIYRIKNIDYSVKNVFLPISQINELRRKAIEKFDNKRLEFEEKVICENRFDIQEFHTKKMFIKVSTKEQVEAAIESGIKNIIYEDKNIIVDYKDNDVHFLFCNNRINYNENQRGMVQNFDLNNALITSVYLGVYNHESVAFLHSLGVKLIGLSLELNEYEIKDLIKQYQKEYYKTPNLLMQVYGYYDLMITKHCLINKEFELKEKHCNLCHNKDFYLTDKCEAKYRLIGDNLCNLHILSKDPIDLSSFINDLPVDNYLLSFTVESKEETTKIINKFLNGEMDSHTYYGNYKQGVE